MKKFIKIFNAIANISNTPSEEPMLGGTDSCCRALDFFNPQNIFFMELEELRSNASNMDKYMFRARYKSIISGAIIAFFEYYCVCQKNLENSNCSNRLMNKITSVNTMQAWIGELEAKHELHPTFLRTLQSFLYAFTEYVDAAVDLPIVNPNFTILVRNDTLKNFLDDMCSMANSEDGRVQFTETESNFWVALIGSAVMDRLISDDYLASQVSVQEAQPALINCPPSANDNTIGALAAALGVSAAFVAVALAALRRGKTKQCSDVAVTARNLTPLLIAATGASFATTQTSEATVQERLQAVLQKDCEGRLPYSCGEGGFEGPDGGDASGEVDAPSGGGIGGI